MLAPEPSQPQTTEYEQRHRSTPRVISACRNLSSTARGILEKLRLSTSLPDRVTAQCLANRGLEASQDLDTFLHPSLQHLPNPSRFKNFDAAIEMILSAINRRERIGIVGDYDVDGTTAVAQFVSTLTDAKSDHRFWIPNRFNDGYGINDRIVREIVQADCKLVVLFDHGTHAIAQVAELQRQGIPVVIFDHHTVGDVLPAGILVNPRQPDCGLHHEYPCASGLAYFVCARLSAKCSLPTPDCGLAALGTIVDVVPLHGANRTIARIGLSDLRRTDNDGIIELCNRLGIDHRELQSSDLGFQIGPAINAAGRMDDGTQCVELLTTHDRNRACEIARELHARNEVRKTKQRELLLDADRSLNSKEIMPRALVSYRPYYHPGLVGLIAQGLAQRYTRPVFILAPSLGPSDSDEIRGSARAGHESFDLVRILSLAKQRDLDGVIIKWGGHPAAAGVSIQKDAILAFSSLINKAFKELYPKDVKEVAVHADCPLKVRELTPSFVASLDRLLEPYGQGFEAPRFLFESLTVRAVHSYSGKRYMLVLEQNNATVRAFVGPELWNGDITPGATIDIVATPASVYRNDSRHVQVTVNAYRVIHDAPTKPLELRSATQQLPAPITEPKQEPPEQSLIDGIGEPARKPSQLAKLHKQLEELEKAFARRYIYPELQALADQLESRPKGSQFLLPSEASPLWEKLSKDYGLSLRTDGLQYRPAHIEFIRHFFDQPGNHFLQAPTGSGKTEVALVIASHYRNKGSRVIFLAPTIEIVRQVAERAERMLNNPATILDGKNAGPKKRATIHAAGSLGFVVGTPAALRNDQEAGIFAFQPDDLLIVDEAHHAVGEYPFVPLVEAARKIDARILMLSATPGQMQQKHEWPKFDDMLNMLGVDHVFPINMRVGERAINGHRLEQSEEIKAALSVIERYLTGIRQELWQIGAQCRVPELIKQVSEVFGKKDTARVASWPRIQPLLELTPRLGSSESRASRLLYAAGEVYQSHHTLAQRGICAFLLRCVEGRCRSLFPKDAQEAKSSITLVYRSSEIERVYRSLARGVATGLWSQANLEKAFGISRKEFLKLDETLRKTIWNREVRRLKREVMDSLVNLEYSDHPKEERILRQLININSPTFLSLGHREDAIFLAARITAKLAPRNIRAVPFSGEQDNTTLGITHQERQRNLEAFNNKDAKVIVSTSAGNEGVDIEAEFGWAVVFDGSQIKATQKQGRVGRRAFGMFEYLLMDHEDEFRYKNILRKVVEFQKMLNEHRSMVMEARGLSPQRVGNPFRKRPDDSPGSQGELF